jgi:uncharacterized protein YecT (DUF1311 family)
VVWLAVIAGLQGSVAAHAESPLEACTRAGGDRPQLRSCLDARVKVAEGALADAYRAMRAAMERLDQASGQPVLAKRFEGVQQAFRDYRDRHCAWVGVKTQDPGRGSNLVRDCRIRLAEERTRELQAQMPLPAAAEPAPPEAGSPHLPTELAPQPAEPAQTATEPAQLPADATQPPPDPALEAHDR